FTVPDALSRWRITGRAITSTGSVGQGTAEISSAKDYYLKWTGPTTFRSGDTPTLSLVGFNLGVESRSAVFTAEGLGLHVRQEVELQPGANYLSLPLTAQQGGTIITQLTLQGQVVDRLETQVAVVPQGWVTTRSQPVAISDQSQEVPLPNGAS